MKIYCSKFPTEHPKPNFTTQLGSQSHSMDKEIVPASVSDPAPPGCPYIYLHCPYNYISCTPKKRVDSTHTSLGTGHSGTNQTLKIVSGGQEWQTTSKGT